MAQGSIIAPQVRITGTLICSADVTVAGMVDGNIHASGHVMIDQNGKVTGIVCADQVTVRGEVQGDLRARKVHLAATCTVKADVVHTRITVEDGAVLDGHFRQSDEALPSIPPEFGSGLGEGVRARKTEASALSRVKQASE